MLNILTCPTAQGANISHSYPIIVLSPILTFSTFRRPLAYKVGKKKRKFLICNKLIFTEQTL